MPHRESHPPEPAGCDAACRPSEVLAENAAYLMSGLKMVHGTLRKLVGCTTYRAFRVFLDLRGEA